MKRTKAGPCSSSWQIHRTRAQRIILLALFGGAILATSPTKAEAEKSCENLKSFAFPNAKIIDASSKPGGSYRAPDAFGTPPVPPPPMPPLPYLSFSDLPPWCQVSAEIKPTPDSNINVQVWLPTERYNGDYLGTGNAGYGGNYIQSELAQGINNGFATANTDMGTSPTQFGVWADNLVGHPEKWRDFGWRSTHLMTEFSKALIQQFYGKPTNHSYFAGCSTGGQQALMEAERFPYDYDGILAGAPAFNRTHLLTVPIAQYKATHELSAAAFQESQMKAQSLPTKSNGQEAQALPSDPNVQEPMFTRVLQEASQEASRIKQLRAAEPKALVAKTGSVWEKLDTINKAVLNECLGQAQGPKADTFLTDPRDCKFDPATLQCSAPPAPNCLTTDQVEAMRVYYEGAVNPSNGAIINPGNVPGSETSNVFAMGFAFNEVNPKMEPAFDSLFKWVLTPPPWQWRTFDFDHNVAAVDDVLESELNANSTDLWRFKNHGGKLILYSGWADPMIPSPVTINYFNAVTQTMFGSLSAGAVTETQKFARLFMAPGMWHCGMSLAAGPGPNSFGGMVQQPAPSFDAQHDLLSALTLWVEKGIPPTLVIATKYNDDQPEHGIAMQRPICVFPEIAEYDGLSNPSLPASFKCVVNHPSNYNNEKPAPQYGP
jgi:feruloyl esterase